MIGRPVLKIFILFLMIQVSPVASADEVESAWIIDLKGGLFYPDLPLYKQFYGDDKDVYISGALAYRFTPWLDLGGEIGYFNDTGVGLQPANMTTGGKVSYTLLPATLYVNFRGEFSREQLFVPYVGGGLTTAWYRQKVDSQGTIDGRTDLGYNLRGGVQLLLNRLDPRAAKRRASGSPQRSYLYFEAQYFTADVDQTDVGGVAYLLGLRLEYGWGRD